MICTNLNDGIHIYIYKIQSISLQNNKKPQLNNKEKT